MSIIDVDIILEKLSTKFNKIFYDREFVCCVQEDLKSILKNRSKCCVVVFPMLGPNYLKAVQYQAKFSDLEVFTLGSHKICSIAVCDKKFLIKKTKDCDQQMMSNIEQECGTGSTLRKKRPERQLYIPPAQRRLPVNNSPERSKPKNDQGNSTKTKKSSPSSRKLEPQKKVDQSGETSKLEIEYIPALNGTSIDDSIQNKNNQIATNYTFMWWKYALFEPSFQIPNYVCSMSLVNSKHMCNMNLDGLNIFDLQQKEFTLYILGNDYFFWQPKIDISGTSGTDLNLKVIPPCDFDVLNIEVDVFKRIALTEVSFPRKTYSEVLGNFSIYCNFDVFLLGKLAEPCNFLDVCCRGYYYILRESESQSIGELIEDLLSTDDCHYEKKIKTKTVNENEETQVTIDLPVIEKPKNELHSMKNNNVNNNFNYLKNTINVSVNVKKEKNELEEEREIMRKTKENINRKTRPIIKYVDESKPTLKIEKNDVSNWEDLFDEEGQLQEDLLKEIIHKVGDDVKIVKAKEDYSDYFSKHVNIEELEHMVELYDFPATLETHDLIHAFSEIKSDAMYVKWVDDTHAILVLGSSSQAQKAMSVQNPLIKVRPMTAASKTSLSTAYRNDLKPAMKRPPTNLQTARRLITTHLGTKSGISKETSAKERDDLKAAREMKKLVRKNEQDAWEGKLKSSIN